MQQDQNTKPSLQRGKALRGMTSVQDSINALYFEAERNANDGKPMFAILHGAPADDPATTMLSGRPEDIYPVNFGVTSSPPEPRQVESQQVESRQVEPRQVEPRHADSPGADSHLVHTEIDARTDATTDADSGTDDHEDHDDGGQANGQKLLAARLDDLYALAEQEATAPEQPDVPPEQPDVQPEQPDILADNAPDSLAGDSPDSSPAHSGREPVDNPAPVTALPEQPPAPPQMGLDTDLNISDIHDLVQQAWDDGDADDRDADDRDAVSGTVHDDGSPDQPPTMTKAPAMNLAPAKAGADHIEPGHIEPDESGPANETDIKAAMVEIAAAVNQLDTPVPAHMHGLKDEIVEAIKAELRAAMHADIAPIVRRAVAEVLAETAAQELAAKKETVGKKVAAKKAPKKPARAKTPDIKATGKTTTTKTTATKKTATGKPAKARRTKSSGSGKT
jgi:hypothetical protein